MSKTKKILSSIMAIVLFACCFVVLTACDKDNNGDGEGGNNTPKTVEVGTYTQLTEAIGGDADVIKVTEDIDFSTQVNIARKVTIDLNGKRLYNTENIDNEDTGSWSFFSVKENGNLTLTGNGTIEVKENDSYTIDVRGGKLTIENGTFIGNVSVVYVRFGEATINGGSYSLKQLDNNTHDERFTLNLYDANGQNGTAKITVKGGEFKNFDPANNLAEGEGTNFVATGFKSQVKSTDTTTGVTIYEVVADVTE